MNISSTVDQALRLMMQLADTPDQTPAELARSLDLNRTAVHRLLATLHRRGFVTRVGGAAIYALGPTVLRMAESVQPDIQQVARSVLEELSEATSETVLLFIPDLAGPQPRAVAIDQVETRAHVVRVEFDLGHSIPLHQGAAAQAILAFSTPEILKAALKYAADPAAVRAALAATRERGYATTHDELLNDVAGIAVPIIDGDRTPLGSISIVTPATRATRLDGFVDDLLAAASRIRESLHASTEEVG